MAGTPNTSNTNLSISALMAAGVSKLTMSFTIALATLTDAAQFHVTPGFKGRLMRTYFVTQVVASTAGRLSTLTPSIEAVNLLGGVLALTTVACNTKDKELSGTAITGQNAFTNTQSITWTGSATTAFAEGSGYLVMDLMNDDTLEALAKALNGLRTP